MAPANTDSIAKVASQETQAASSRRVPSHDEPLPRDGSVEREIGRGQTHLYWIALDAGQYVHVVVDQKGTDVVLAFYAADKAKLAEVDRWSDTHGLEMISFVANRSDVYWFEVRALEADTAGRYEVRSVEVRAATRQDAVRTTAEKAYAEGDELAGNGDAISQRRAIEKLEDSLKQWQKIGDELWQATTLFYIGTIHYNLGAIGKALDYYDNALPHWQALGDRGGEVATLSSIGLVYESYSEYQLALTYYDRALLLARNLNNREWGEAFLLHNLGIVYTSLGEFQKALSSYDEAVQIHKAQRDKAAEAHVLHHIGEVYVLSGEHEKATYYLNEALADSRAEDDPLGVATSLNHLGRLQFLAGKFNEALNNYTEALQLRRSSGYRLGEAQTLNNIGEVYRSLRDYQRAFDYFSEALRLRQELGDHRGEAETLYGLAHTELETADKSQALTHIKAALKIIESIRAKVANRELRTSYFATVQDYYELYIDILMGLHKAAPSAGYDSAAVHISERKRARILLETLNEAQVNIRQGVQTSLIEQEEFFRREIRAKAGFQLKLLGGSHTDAEANAISNEIDFLSSEFDKVETQIRKSSPAYASLMQPEPLTLGAIQSEVLDQNTLLLEFSLGPKQSYLWAVTQTSVSSYELPNSDEIEKAARDLYQLLTSRNHRNVGEDSFQWQKQVSQADAQFPAAATHLSQMLLSPIASQLGKKRLLIVTEGALQFIPFSILPVTSTDKPSESVPLMFQHEIVNLPSASTIPILRAEKRNKKPVSKVMVVIADPVFENDDKRMRSNATGRPTSDVEHAQPAEDCQSSLFDRARQEASLGDRKLCIPRLKGTRREGEGILSLASSRLRKRAFDFDASRQTVDDPDLGNYQYVHFATHGIIDSVHPALSAVVLSLFDQDGAPLDGFLRVHDIFNLKLGADVVVLSACETGLGKDVKGEGLISLTRGFMYAGAPRVVVSLWSVDDAATAKLMIKFYQGMIRDNLGPARALQLAQIYVWKDRQFRFPFYWAAFTIQGDWQ